MVMALFKDGNFEGLDTTATSIALRIPNYDLFNLYKGISNDVPRMQMLFFLTIEIQLFLNVTMIPVVRDVETTRKLSLYIHSTFRI